MNMQTRILSIRLLFAFSLVLAAAPAAQSRDISVEQGKSGERVALVIGNGAYPTAPLRNPVNDARLMTDALRALGFNVEAYENLSQKQMNRAIKTFGARLSDRGAVVGLFYFAGHGMQVNGRNYLIPIDAEIRHESDVDIESVDVGTLVAQMEAWKNRLNIVVLDACRDNPFAGRFRSLARGLASMDAPAGTLIAYATAPGRIALDGPGPNSPYTAALAKAIALPGLRIEDVFKRVRQAVRAETRDEQVPWESSSLVADFMFVAPERAADRNLAALTGEVMRKSSLSVAAGSEGSHAEAERLALEAVKDAEVFGLQDSRLGYALSVLARAQLLKAQYSEADTTTERALSIVEKAGDANAAFALTQLGLSYLEVNRPVQAERFLTRGVSVAESAWGSAHPITGGMLANLAVAYLQKFEPEQAEPLVARALKLADASLDRGDTGEPPHKSLRAAGDLMLASGLSYAAVTYSDHGDYTRADEIFRRAVPLHKKLRGQDELNIAQNLEWHAKTLKRLNREREATEIEAEAQAIRARQPR
jgi:uncharacterized caspase-like protein